MRTRAPISRLLALAALLVAPAAHAAWPSDPSVNLPLSAKATSKLDLTSSPDGNGGVFVVWVETISGSYDIWAQHVSATGQLLWGPNGVAVTVNSVTNETVPNIIADGSGGAWVAWAVNTNGNDIYAQHLTAAGSPVTGANGIFVCNDATSQVLWNGANYLVPMVADGYGGVYIAWWDYRNTNSDVFLQRISTGCVLLLSQGGLAIGSGAGNQMFPAMTSNGAGGVYIAWQDDRSGNQDIYGQHVTASSVIANSVAWTANGVALSNAALDQTAPAITSDGIGGFHAAWLDTRSGTNTAIYAARFTSSAASFFSAVPVCNATGGRSRLTLAADGVGGTLYFWFDTRNNQPNLYYVQRANALGTMLWTTDGVSVSSTGSSIPGGVSIPVADGTGGAVVTFTGLVGSTEQVFANRVSSTGAVMWGTGGTLLHYYAGSSYRATGVSDGNGGLISTWYDSRNGNAYAQRIDRYGYLGSPEPAIASVRDITFDQGGQVKVVWNASYRDAEGVFGVAEYRLWRSAPALAAASLRARLVTTDPDLAAARGGIYTAQGYSWELVGSQAAAQLPQYNLVAATTADSMSTGNPRTVFMVEARAGTSLSSQHWFSAPDSGYSVDNLAPSAPAPFAGTYTAGTAVLHWRPNTESDLAGYRLYRGPTYVFPLDNAHRVATLTDTGYVDVAGGPAYYRLTAVDVHGNEGPSSGLMPLGTTDVGAGAVALALATPSPNPLRGRANTTIAFTLPSAQRVTIAVFDAVGRPARTLAVGVQSAGAHTIPFDGLGANGTRLAAGLYFVRLDAGGQHLTRRLVLLD